MVRTADLNGDISHHRMSCSTYKQSSLLGLLGESLVSLLSLGCYFFLSLFLVITIEILSSPSSLFSIIKWLLSQAMNFTFYFQFSSPLRGGERVSEHLHGTKLMAGIK